MDTAFCINTEASYTCECESHLVMQDDGSCDYGKHKQLNSQSDSCAGIWKQLVHNISGLNDESCVCIKVALVLDHQMMMGILCHTHCCYVTNSIPCRPALLRQLPYC